MIYVGWYEPMKQYVIVWLDVWGGASPESVGYAQPGGNSMPFLFKGAGDVTHTTFTYNDANDTWTWQIDTETGGKYKPFARVTLTRIGRK
jgi:hypothetical protein